MQKVEHLAEDLAEERVLTCLPQARSDETPSENDSQSTARQFSGKSQQGELDNKEIEIKVAEAPTGVEIMAPPGLEDMTSQLKSMFSNMNLAQTLTATHGKAALKTVKDEEAAKLIDEEEIKTGPLRLLSKPASFL